MHMDRPASFHILFGINLWHWVYLDSENWHWAIHFDLNWHWIFQFSNQDPMKCQINVSKKNRHIFYTA
jgi:hypothetical protein